MRGLLLKFSSLEKLSTFMAVNYSQASTLACHLSKMVQRETGRQPLALFATIILMRRYCVFEQARHAIAHHYSFSFRNEFFTDRQPSKSRSLLSQPLPFSSGIFDSCLLHGALCFVHTHNSHHYSRLISKFSGSNSTDVTTHDTALENTKSENNCVEIV